ncbi:hypothetical protein LTR62_000696 [Meristemomyces frigidus]|uniref:5-formyltetrahydrofolate cyclo-ligase n=1 Tax=Meristemomyces frigidus TaxID=1508187 RepID=A0AAN7YLF4_9PEZI|nr:hypothetical protein LTR62_000696 [Meristemomyces frigidus]
MVTESHKAKRALRQTMKTRLSNLDEQTITKQSETAQELILSLPQYESARRVCFYLSMPTGEAQTDLLVRNALTAGKQVFVPYLHSTPQAEGSKGKGKVMEMLRLESVDDYEGLVRDGWGIPSLSQGSVDGRENAEGGRGIAPAYEDEHKSAGGLDMIVVPGVAFDAEMSRLGHGAGYYDRYLTRTCGGDMRKKPFLVGLCLAAQVVAEDQIVMSEWDWRVDAVVVGDGRLLQLQASA